MTQQECKRFESMAKLDLPPDERQWVMEQAGRLEAQFAELDRIDTDGVLPLVTVSELSSVLREDVSFALLPREELLAGAPEQYDGYFQVPKTMV